MKIDVNSITTANDVVTDFESVMDRLEGSKELFVFQNNRPRCVLISIEQYEVLIKEDFSNADESGTLDDVVETLNKIGKQVFVNFYYVFKQDDSPEEKLPKDFTLNSKRSRTSNARKLFRENKNITALEIIAKSDRLDDETIQRAKEILENENKDFNNCINNIEDNKSIASGNNEIKIGKLIKNTFINMCKDNRIPQDEIERMTTPLYSKETFNLNFPVLKEIDNSILLDKQKKDSKGYNRYYRDVIIAYGKKYLLCSQWVEGLHRSSFNKWLSQYNLN